jgi:methionyl-tRNA formyltransferase
VVLLTGWEPQHLYVARALQEVLGERLSAVVLPSGGPERLWIRFRRGVRRYSVRDFLSRVHWRAWRRITGAGRRANDTVRRTLFPDGSPAPLPDPLVHIVPDHNGEQCRTLLLELRPRILAVYGTDLIRRPVIELATEVALNLHTGISPRYRGSSSVFWALHNEEPEWVGSTVHVLDPGVDSGDVLGTVRPEITSDDDEASLFAKCVQEGAGLYADVIVRALEGPVPAEPQVLEHGQQYRFVDRTVRAERRVQRLLRDGLLRRHQAGE